MEAFFEAIDPATVVGKLVTIVVVALVAYFIEKLVVRLTRAAFEAADVPNATIFVNILRVVIWSVALLSILQPVFGIDPSGFITALGVVSVALSLGLQDTISNVIGGLMLMFGKVVKPGDSITVDDMSGTVEDVTWRHTLVRDRYGTVDVVPNSVINSDALIRRTRWNATDCSVPVVVVPDADLDAVTDDVVSTVDEALGDKLDPAFATELTFTEINEKGYVGKVHLHVKDDVSLTAAADAVVRALAHKPWLSRLTLANGKAEGK